MTPKEPARRASPLPFAHLITTAHYENTNGEIRGNKRQSSKLRKFVNLSPNSLFRIALQSHLPPLPTAPSQLATVTSGCHSGNCLTTEKFKASSDKLQHAGCN
ncbi:hypothetical protein CDAR_618051 [Caerostris darwini]|uniref:Uncharacterized protein n=1 Tax=Caerostris darwini TaxID=1538125 RepID=A0AAV4U8S0_9ARAC|nr:hypothetical protein CDAR_618051 [Caerostris darwini]